MSLRRRTCLTVFLAALALPAVAQAPEPGLPRVLYGTPQPQVFYGNPPATAPSAEPRRAPPPAPRAAAPPPTAPQGSLTYQSGPAYIPPQAWWGVQQRGWGGQPGWERPPRAWREPPVNPPRYVSPDRGRFERPLPEGRYVGRPPSAPPGPVYGRPPGF
jgi:hypothetical protein